MFRSVARMRSRWLYLHSRSPPSLRSAHTCVNPRKLKVSGRLSPRPARRLAAYLPNSIRRVFSALRARRKLRQPGLHVRAKAFGVIDVLETDNDVVRVADDHYLAPSLAPSPALCPEVEDVVEVDVRQQR